MADERALVVNPGTIIPGEPRILIEGTGPEFEYILNLPPWTPITGDFGDEEENGDEDNNGEDNVDPLTEPREQVARPAVKPRTKKRTKRR